MRLVVVMRGQNVRRLIGQEYIAGIDLIMTTASYSHRLGWLNGRIVLIVDGESGWSRARHGCLSCLRQKT